VNEHLPPDNKGDAASNSIVRACFGRAFYVRPKDRQKLATLADSLHETAFEKNNPMRLLYRWYSSSDCRRNKSNTTDIYYKTARAIQAGLNDEEISVLVRPTKDPFPMDTPR
jgi:hypothetical protein